MIILDKIDNLVNYPQFQIVKNFLDKNDIANLKVGRYVINETCYLNVSKYDTDKGKRLFEGHREYIDFQLIIEGEEYVQVQNIDKCVLELRYDSQKDVAFYSATEWNNFYLGKNQFIVLSEDDIHRPCVFINNPDKVKKFVFKIKK